MKIAFSFILVAVLVAMVMLWGVAAPEAPVGISSEQESVDSRIAALEGAVGELVNKVELLEEKLTGEGAERSDEMLKLKAELANLSYKLTIFTTQSSLEPQSASGLLRERNKKE